MYRENEDEEKRRERLDKVQRVLEEKKKKGPGGESFNLFLRALLWEHLGPWGARCDLVCAQSLLVCFDTIICPSPRPRSLTGRLLLSRTTTLQTRMLMRRPT